MHRLFLAFQKSIIHNLLEYNKKYSKTTENVWNYYRDEPSSGVGGANNNINNSIKDSKSSDYKISITGEWEVTTQKKKLNLLCH